jgi:hypothetical protein
MNNRDFTPGRHHSQVLQRGAKTVARNQLIDSGMPPFDGLLT